MSEIVGTKFNDWEVIGTTKKWNNAGWMQTMLVCRCKCGKEAVQVKENLTSGKSKSCRQCSKGMKRHGLYKHKLYAIWQAMKQRCLNEDHDQYEHYGERKIAVCQTWIDSPETFIEWCMENGWEEGLQIDRRENDLGYSPDNCRFITLKANLRNSRLLKKKNTTGLRGISKIVQIRGIKYRSTVTFEAHEFRVGHFNTALEAAQARDAFIIHCGMPLPLNFPNEEFDREIMEDNLDVELCLTKAKEELKRIRESRK